MQRIGGSRRKSRYKLHKEINRRGKVSITNYLRIFKKGDLVALSSEPALHSGMYHTRFYGKSGVIKSRVGRCYEVTIKDYKKEKTLIVHPAHLKAIALQA